VGDEYVATGCGVKWLFVLMTIGYGVDVGANAVVGRAAWRPRRVG